MRDLFNEAKRSENQFDISAQVLSQREDPRYKRVPLSCEVIQCKHPWLLKQSEERSTRLVFLAVGTASPGDKSPPAETALS